MKKIFTVLFALALLSCNVFATEISDISLIEKEIFGIEYNDETISKRLSRLEKYLFGSEKTGNNQIRINNISDASGISFTPKMTPEEKKVQLAEIMPEESNVSYPVIDMMENEIFHKNYQGENVYKRVERLEKKAFGKTIEGDLSERTDKLKAALLAIQPEKITYDEEYNPSNIHSFQRTPIQKYDDEYITSTNELFGFSTGGAASPLFDKKNNDNDDFQFALTSAENLILGTTNKNNTVAERLNKLEKKVFKKTFSDDKLTRLNRVVSAAHAQKTGKTYKENKMDRYIATGIQVGTIILMILAMIL